MLRRIFNKLSRLLENKDISQKLSFIKTSKNYLNEYFQTNKSKGIFFCFYQSTLKPYALSLVLFKRLLKNKWSIVSLDDDLKILPKLYDKDLFEFYNKFYKKKIETNYYKLNDHKKLILKWKINHEKKECISLGINFYGTIMNLLSKEHGCYYPNVQNKKILNEFNNLILTCDHCLYLCYKIEKISRLKKIPIRISGFNTNYPPSSVFKLYCINRGYKFNIHFVEIKQSYERLKNRFNEFVNSINIERSSHDYNKRSQLLFRHQDYIQWFENKKSNNEFLIPDFSKEKFIKNTFLKKIDNFKEKKYKIYSAFLNIPIDMPHPNYDDGFIHKDQLDFIKNIIFEILKNKKNIIIIKKHPDSDNKKYQNVKIDNFSNYLKKIRNKRVIFIDKPINNLKLYKLIDVSLIWRSNIGTETLARGIPTFFFSKNNSLPFGKSFQINSLKKFKKYLKKTPVVDRKTIEMSKFYMDYVFKNKIDYNIGKIPYKFHRNGYPIINLKKLNNFNIKEIDKKIRIDFK